METEVFPKLINTVNAFVFLEFHFDSAYSADKAFRFRFVLSKRLAWILPKRFRLLVRRRFKHLEQITYQLNKTERLMFQVALKP